MPSPHPPQTRRAVDLLPLALLGVAVCSCGAGVVPADASPGDVAPADAAPVDATPDAAPDASCTLAPAGAWSAVVRGSAPSEWLFPVSSAPAPTLTESLDLYLPEGRVAGGRFVLAFVDPLWDGVLVSGEGRFAADGSSPPVMLNGVRGGTVGYTVTFPPGAAPPSTAVSRNLETMVDVPRDVHARLTLCPAEATSAPQLWLGPRLAPTSALVLRVATPLGAGAEGVRLLADDAPVPATVTRERESVVVTPARALRPTARLTLDASSLRDVMGRPYMVPSQPELLRTTAAVTDWTFTTAPPAGAVASTVGSRVTDGALSASIDFAQPYRMVIALGAPPAGAAALELRYAVRGSCESHGAWLVSEAGEAERLAVMPGGSFTARATVPAGGAVWLVVESTQGRNTPGWGVPVVACTLAIDEVRAVP